MGEGTAYEKYLLELGSQKKEIRQVEEHTEEAMFFYLEENRIYEVGGYYWNCGWKHFETIKTVATCNLTGEITPTFESDHLHIVQTLQERPKSTKSRTVATSITYPPMPYYMVRERPTQQTQHVYVDGNYRGGTGCCVANATTACAEIMAIRRNKPATRVSLAWMWGKIGFDENEGSWFEDGAQALIDNGAVVAELLFNDHINIPVYPDTCFLSDAKILYNKNISTTAQSNKATSSTTIPALSNYYPVFSALQDANKVVYIGFGVDTSFDSYQAQTTGVVPPIGKTQTRSATQGASPGQPEGESRGGHAMVLLGWMNRAVNGTSNYYWICQNSWTYLGGGAFGDNGLYYIPFDWTTSDYSSGLWNFYIVTYGASYPFTRPQNFSYDTAKIRGEVFDLTVQEQLRLEQKINWMRCYKNMPPLVLSRVFSGDAYKADRFKSVINALNDIPGHGNLPGEAWSVVKGDAVKASHLNDMRSSLNNIT